MKSSHYIFGILFLVILFSFILIKSGAGNTENVKDIDSIKEGNKITLSYKNYNYYPNTITVKSGEPVRIYLDDSVKGCFRQFVIRDFGVNKYLKTPNDYLDFTPNKKGTFTFQCGMGMGTGKLIVE